MSISYGHVKYMDKDCAAANASAKGINGVTEIEPADEQRAVGDPYHAAQDGHEFDRTVGADAAPR